MDSKQSENKSKKRTCANCGNDLLVDTDIICDECYEKAKQSREKYR